MSSDRTKKNNSRISRRSFLNRAWTWLGVIAGVELSVITLNFLATGKKKEVQVSNSFLKVAGPIDSMVPGSVIPFRNGQFYLVRMEDGGFLALSLACTHLGCAVSYDNTRNEFICPCHSSAFDRVGNVLKPPATRALDTYRVIIESGMVKVDTSRKIKRKGFAQTDLVYA
jgi:cytochrome b6-f complex iron-sulfur subunit